MLGSLIVSSIAWWNVIGTISATAPGLGYNPLSWLLILTIKLFTIVHWLSTMTGSELTLFNISLGTSQLWFSDSDIGYWMIFVPIYEFTYATQFYMT